MVRMVEVRLIIESDNTKRERVESVMRVGKKLSLPDK